MRTTIFPSVSYKFLSALALVAMLLAALPAMSAFAASITVNTTADENTANASCSLREAIIAANNNVAHNGCAAGSGAEVDVITLASGSTYALSLVGTTSTLGDLDISDPAGLTIQASSTTAAIIDGGDIDRVLDVSAAAGSLTLTNITVQNGNTTGQATTTGAGIGFGSNATLTLTNSTVSSNIATATAGCGAGIYNNTAATVNITNSTITGNSCAEVGADGGGLSKNGGILNITNSTFSGNSANDDGGGMRIEAATAAITNSTFSGNIAGNRGGAIQVNGATTTIEFSTFSGNAANAVGNNGGGAIQISAGSTAINRSILANSTAGQDCHQSATGVGTLTNSLVEQDANCAGTPTSTADPVLGLLANNGGPTLTMAITNASPAYNAASTCNSITTDQRGITRPQAGSCDLGAFEVAPPTVLTITRVSPNPVSSFNVDYTVTFSEAVTGVGPSDFSLTTTGSILSASVTGVSGSGAIYTVTVNTGTGTGTIRLDVPVSASIVDLDGNQLTGLPFTSGEVYDKVAGPPVAATLVSPTGATTDTTPTYTWNKAFGADWYYLWVNGPSGTGITKIWYEGSAVCGASTCSVTPSVPASLSTGAYTWWIQTWNASGYGPWSSAMNFSITATPPPGTATLVSPSGTITDTTPTYTWNKVTGATWYYLWVNRPSADPIKVWYDAAVVCGATTCTTPSPATFGAGAHTWWIQTWNTAGGYGAWSAGLSFTVSAPAAATLVSPSGNISDTTPNFTWNKVAGADWYYLWVNRPSADPIKVWYDAAVVCGATTCTTPSPATFGAGAHTWWVQTWSNAGYGPWSSAMNFSLP